MFKNILTIIFRSLFRFNIFSIINILGLSIGLAVVLLFSLYNFTERSFDNSFKQSKDIYRINSITDSEHFATTANAVGPALKEIPEVISSVRIFTRGIGMSINDNPILMTMRWVDPDFFNFFETPFISGSPEDLMSRPNTIAVSEREAKKLFGDSDPMGQLIIHTVYKSVPPMEVVAVYKDYPESSSFREFNLIAPFMHCYESPVHSQITWIVDEFETFCLLAANANIQSVNAKIKKIVSDATADEQKAEWTPQLQKLTDIHLHSKKLTGQKSSINSGDIGKVRLLSLLSVIILLVACVNYVNLSTARAQKRSKEIGISKTVGAQRSELILRLTLETAIFTFISLIVAFFLARIILPTFNDLAGAQLSFKLVLQPVFLFFTLLIWIITTFLAAAYPVLNMSGFPPITAIQSASIPNSSRAIVRKALIIGQFAVAIVLITWVLIIQMQIYFSLNKDLGYNPHNLIGFWIHDSNPTSLLDEFRAQSSVEMVSRENQSSVFGVSSNTLFKDPDDVTGFRLKVICADPNYIDLMQMKLIAGNHFPETQISDTTIDGRKYSFLKDMNTYVVLNRAAVDYLGYTPEEAIGKTIIAPIDHVISPRNPSVIICGVIENFHFESLYRPIGGYCVHYGLGNPKRYLVLRVTEGNMPEQLKKYEEIYKKYFPNNTFSPKFREEEVAKFYDGERRTGHIAVVFAVLAIFVACLGVIGLTAFVAEQRKREIGIRKVMGASVWDIVKMFTSDYVKLLSISLLISIPVAWWIGEKYLQNFAYHISLSWWIFAVAALITAVLTLLTVSALAIKAAMNNPQESLKLG